MIITANNILPNGRVPEIMLRSDSIVAVFFFFFLILTTNWRHSCSYSSSEEIEAQGPTAGQRRSQGGGFSPDFHGLARLLLA